MRVFVCTFVCAPVIRCVFGGMCETMLAILPFIISSGSHLNRSVDFAFRLNEHLFPALAHPHSLGLFELRMLLHTFTVPFEN